jgi:3-hydroxyacyl-CoA dehydrogenase
VNSCAIFTTAFSPTFSHRIPEITEELYRIDDAMKAGFGWEIGAFESWDVLGVEKKTLQAMKAAGYDAARCGWMKCWLQVTNHFIKRNKAKRLCYDPASKTYKSNTG